MHSCRSLAPLFSPFSCKLIARWFVHPLRSTRGSLAPAPRAASAASSSAASGTQAKMTPAAALDVYRIPALSDNYIWLLHDPNTGTTGVVDPAEAAPVNQVLASRGLPLHFILNTHHHGDHTGANLALKQQHGCTIIGPRADAQRIPGIDQAVGDGDVFKFGALDVHAIDTPGHTKGHITLWIPEAEALFPGDTLFAMGCGRLFEGSPQQMWESLSKLLALGAPRSTRVYCAHEYTQSNARFAVTVDPSNEKLLRRKQQVDEARQRGEATVPSTLGEELDTNPFLRPGSPAIRQHLGFSPSDPDHQVFAAVRKAKDRF